MAISKIILNGVTQMDVTGKTVTSASMRSGVTALKNDGTDITGSLADMTLPSAASASSSGTSKATITPTSSAQYLNIPTGYNDTAQFYTIAATSGGASNVVTGTFKGTTTGAAMDVNIPYTGNGYPIAISIYPKGGTVELSSLIQRYAIVQAEINKYDASLTPDYNASGQAAYGTLSMIYKNSTSNAATIAASTAMNTRIYRNSDSSAGSTTFLRIKSNKKLSVFIASTSYGFVANTEYTYHIIYSS